MEYLLGSASVILLTVLGIAITNRILFRDLR